VAVELVVLGASGSYGAPRGGACSGYLVRAGRARLWVDTGNGTLAELHRHLDPEDIDAVVVSHEHPDHCADLLGFQVLLKWKARRSGMAVYAPAGVRERLAAVVDDFEETFDWRTVDDGDRAEVGDARLRFARTDHPVPTLAVEVAAEGRRLVYTADTGPKWSVAAFEPAADLVLSEASYQDASAGAPLHLTARQAGEAARAARARRLVITHVWPPLDPEVSVWEAAEGFGAPVELARPGALFTL
jgi:ribonuclease BN (tRNA processing enzyme)